MNIKLISLLAIICSILLLIIGLEWGASAWMRKSILDSLVVTESKTTQDEIPHIDLHKKTEESYVDLVSRPLFISGRRNVEKLSSEEGQSVAQVPVVFDWELNGIFSTKKGLTAFLCHLNISNPKDKYRKISKNELLDGWKLTEIYQDKIIFAQGDQQKELMLRKIKNKSLSNMSNINNRSRNLQFNPQTPAAVLPENTNE